jgi:hypothetical protein
MTNIKHSMLSFESCAQDVAQTLLKDGEAEAWRHAQSYQRNFAWDAIKLYKEAIAINKRAAL